MWALASQSGSSSSGAQRSRRSNPFRTSGNGLQQEVRECMGIERGAPGPQVWWTRMFSLVLAFQHLRYFFFIRAFHILPADYAPESDVGIGIESLQTVVRDSEDFW